MGLEAATIAYLSAAVGAAGTVGSVVQQNKAAGAQEKARDVQQAQQELQDRRNRLRIIREERIKRAQIETAAANTGTATSSGAQGGAGSVTSQATANLNNINQNAALANQGSEYLQRAADARSTGSLFGTLGNLGQTVFNDRSGYKTIFK